MAPFLRPARDAALNTATATIVPYKNVFSKDSFNLQNPLLSVPDVEFFESGFAGRLDFSIMDRLREDNLLFAAKTPIASFLDLMINYKAERELRLLDNNPGSGPELLFVDNDINQGFLEQFDDIMGVLSMLNIEGRDAYGVLVSDSVHIISEDKHILTAFELFSNYKE